MPTTTQVRQIVIRVDAAGVKEALDKISGSMGQLNKNTKSIKDNFQLLTNAFQGWVAFLGVREVARMSDEMQNLSNRLKIVSKSGEDTTQTMVQILDLANRTNQSVSDTAEVYTRLGTSLKIANASSQQLLAVTEALVNSFRISGSTGTETAATIIQLSQAFASGTLRGQELRSVMLQNAELARLLRERFGKDLADKAEKGLISIVEVLKILRDNMERINNQAKILAPTFEQTITKALNVAKFAIFQFNEQFKLSAKFATFVDAVVKGMFTLGKAAIDLGTIIYENIDFKLLAAQAFALLAVINPLAASFLLVGGAAVFTTGGIGDFLDKIRNLAAWVYQLRIWIEELALTIDLKFAKAINKVGLLSDEAKEKLALQIDLIRELKETAEGLGRPKYQSTAEDAKKFTAEAMKKAINDLIKQYEKLGFTGGDKLKKIKEILGDINKELLSNTITLEEYGRKLVNFELYKLNREFSEGKFNIFEYNKRLTELKTQELSRQLKNGIISMKEFKTAVEQLNLKELNDKFQAGKITLQEYNEELIKISQQFEPGSALQAGTQAYLDSIGTVSQGVAGAIKNTFSALEDNMLEFIKTGKFNFAQFTQSILDDLLKIIIRASIIKPLADSILNFSIGGGGGTTALPASNSDYTTTAAHGKVFDGGLKKFASGGIVGGPTTFGYGGGKRGLMGEAGPEAIIPLARGSGGDLGVKASITPVTINIINQAGAEVQQKETTGPNGERTIELLIQGKVKEGIQNGSFDKSFQTAYGITRKGS